MRNNSIARPRPTAWTFLAAIFILAGAIAARAQTSPDFAVKGFHIDMRIQVMKMPALKTFAADLRKKGINTLLIEWEAAYPFQNDRIISNRYAYTRSEIADFTAYCKSIGIDVIPLQQSFGHVEYILRHQRYARLREDDRDLSQVCPAQIELNKQLFTSLYKDLISTHSSNYIHIGCDETHLLGHCPRCSKLAAEEGLSKLYFNHVKMLCDIVISLGKVPVLWADIALKYPQYIKLLPKGTILVDWNYGWDVNRFGDHTALANSGYTVWGAPALRSDPDNYYLTRWQYHFNNITNFIPQCRKFGYKGVIMTSWSTSGEYDASFDSGDELKDLYAVRHVYPLSGFNILIDAFIDALAHPFDADTFITGYCSRQYGLDPAAAQLFKTALFMTPYKVVDGRVISPTHLSLTGLQDSVLKASRILDSLQPTKNEAEFNHYRLMARIRSYYITYLGLEAFVNAKPSDEEFKDQARFLKDMIDAAPQLNKEFEELNKDFLYPAAIEEENTIRNYKAQRLYERIANQK